MLFNSYDFILLLLPIGLLGFSLLSLFKKTVLLDGWLILISLAFYYVWSPKYLILLVFSITVNWLIGRELDKHLTSDRATPSLKQKARLYLILGIIFNLGLLGYFKYSNFFIQTANGLGLSIPQIRNLILPLAISFYTFQQISYLAGIFTKKGKTHSFLRYFLFVIFFPQLIAGPIVNPEEMIPQFRKLKGGLNAQNLSLGITIFAIGLFKKAVIADSIARHASPVFLVADNGGAVSFFLAWQAAIAYTLQLYFDFSGYSDMAIGLALMFNIKLPINFFSPYKAVSVGDFWRRWHISLGRFLRDYLYIPLGGSRKGEGRRYGNLLVTMLLGGLWHGANWTFVLWGGLHGLYLCIDHGWKQFLKQRGLAFEAGYQVWLARLLTLLAVVISWVIFRAETLAGGWRILVGMAGGSGFILPVAWQPQLGFLSSIGMQFAPLNHYAPSNGLLLILGALALTLFLPNLYQFMSRESVGLDIYRHLTDYQPKWYAWRPNFIYAFCGAVLFLTAMIFCSQPSEFLYFQF